MSEQIKGTKEITYSAERYLMTAFDMADWISAEYKQISAECKNHPKAFREFYLCACDKVPVDLVRMAVATEPLEENLKKLRSQHLEKRYVNMRQSIMSELSEVTDMLQKEVLTMAATAKSLKESVPNLEELFANEPYIGQKGELLMTEAEPGETDDVENVGDVKHTSDMQAVSYTAKTFTHSVPIENNYKQGSVKKSFFSMFKKKIKAPDLLNELYQDGYSGESIDYIISCIEEGLSEKEIRTFISPKFDVATMKRLRKIYVKGGNKDGK